MGLLAHQEEIIDAIRENYITGVFAPRINGKTHAAIVFAVEDPGRTIFVSHGFAATKEAFAEGGSVRYRQWHPEAGGTQQWTVGYPHKERWIYTVPALLSGGCAGVDCEYSHLR